MATGYTSADLVKFDGTNFQLWKFSASIILKSKKLLEIVDGSVSQPQDTSSAEWKSWDDKNSKAEVILLTSIAQHQLECLVNCKNAAEMWVKLMSIHEQRTEISKELLWQKFYDYRMKEGDSIAAHIAKMESMIRNLRDVNEVVSESAVCSKMLSSLPPKYSNFKTAWDSVTPQEQTFTNLTARLLKEELRMSSSEDETNQLALQVKVLQEKLEKQVKFNNQESGSKTTRIAELKKKLCSTIVKEKDIGPENAESE